MHHYEICSKCILDITVPNIEFDENGECNYCKMHELLAQKYPNGKKGQEKISSIIEEIKRRGKNKKYDCIVGISGGTDSTYCLYLTKKWDLRPLAVHLDNNWNSEIAINNIRKVTNGLNIDLKIVNVDWEEFKDLQIAFLKGSVPEAEIPSDIGIYSTLFKIAAEENISSVINGHSFRTEGTSPLGWTYMDGKYIESVYKKYGEKNKLRNFSNLKILNLFYYIFLKRIKEYRPLEYLDYNKVEAGKILEKEIGWQYYGGHHYESIYTRFIILYILMKKFNIDKRKVSLSAQVRSGIISRQVALEKIKNVPYPDYKIQSDKDYILKKLDLNEIEFEKIISSPIKSFQDYKTYYSLIKKFKFFIKITSKLNLVPQILYEKYAK